MILNPARWTLRSKLLASILALFLTVIVLVGAATVLSTRDSLMRQLDNQLIEAQHSVDAQTGGAPTPSGGRHGPPPGIGGSMLRVTLDAKSRPGAVTTSENYVSSFGTTSSLTSAQVSRLASSSLGVHPTTINLGGSLHNYRLVAVQRADGDVTIVGLPVEPVDHTTSDLARTVAFLGLLGLVTVGGASYFVVRRNLTPLRRVAATAERVSELPLSRGRARTDERVPAVDTDPRTEVGTVGLALNNLLDHVDAALDARHESELQVRQFVADASHELRTPLASIRGYAELSRREREPVPPAVTHALGRIESEAGRMTTLVEDLLLLARLDAGRELGQEPVDMTRVVVETLSDLHAAGPDHTWRLDLPEDVEDIPDVTGDEARLRQVVINLLANARKHTPAGTTVTAGLSRERDNVLVTVTDDGPGIPAEFMPHLFERFTRGDAARTRGEGSTGLGLSIVEAVVAAHNGHVRVDSEPGHTRFTVTLPSTGTSTPEPTDETSKDLT